ncbi:MAG TPA: ATP-binding cassette domain-containing protein, partial [Thermomicrobiales bacterium]|nr:ATP-binding cassette domain-containing protein [Thermomicrobiales bacterium]
MSTVFSVDHVSVVRNDRHLVNDVSFECESGSVIALIGPNGAGKSTLLHLLANDLEPDQGDVRLFDKPLSRYKPRELAQIRAVLPQQTVLQFSYHAAEVVAMGRVPLPPCSREEEDAAVDEALTSTETLHLRDRIYTQLSGGEQSRVSLARVLAQKTPVILLDEPTAALDVRHQHQIMQVAGKLAESGATVISVI